MWKTTFGLPQQTIFQIFMGCLSQILVGSFLNTLSQMQLLKVLVISVTMTIFEKKTFVINDSTSIHFDSLAAI